MAHSAVWLDLPGLAALLFLNAATMAASAQSEVPGEPNRRTDTGDMAQRSVTDSGATPARVLPPLPSTRAQASSVGLPSLYVRTVSVMGNTVFSDAELAEVVAPYEGRPLTWEDLQSLRDALTLHYVSRGYISSGAIIPDQEVKDGVLQVTIVEGRLTEITVSGNERLRDSYLVDRLALGADGVLNMERLRERLQLLQQDRLIERISADLRPGFRPGEGVLLAEVLESRPYWFGVGFDNHRSPSVGEKQGHVYGGTNNLTGYGDRLSAGFDLTEGLKRGDVLYSFPLTARDTRLSAYFNRTDADVVENPFNDIDINSDTKTFGLGLGHPIIRRPGYELVGSLNFERRRSETSLLDEPFSFSIGARDGRSDVSVFRLSASWLQRHRRQLLAARSIFSLGVDAFGATSNPDNIPDGQFFAWLGQFQWVRGLSDRGDELLVRAEMQLTPDALLPMEKFRVGGATTVRGYRESLLVRDEGLAATVELRIPIFRLPIPKLSQSRRDGQVKLAPFFDYGWSDNVEEPSPKPRTISSAGVGLRWDPSPRIHGEIYWAHQLKNDRRDDESGLQERGISFLVNVQLL